MLTTDKRSSGVQRLIDRLRVEGVEEGKVHADQLVAGARQQAAEIIDNAGREAADMLQQAKQEAAALRASCEQALRLAARDAVLALKEEIGEQFGGHVRKIVSARLGDHDFLQRLILEIAGRSVPRENEGPLELLLPQKTVSLNELRQQPEPLSGGTLSHFVAALSRDMLREGVTLGAAREGSSGITVRMKDAAAEVALTDEAVTGLLLRHLQPRFQALLESVEE